MSKIKIYELAKEIGATSKEVMDFLAGKDMGVKSHMNSIEDTEANQVMRRRKRLSVCFALRIRRKERVRGRNARQASRLILR